MVGGGVIQASRSQTTLDIIKEIIKAGVRIIITTTKEVGDIKEVEGIKAGASITTTIRGLPPPTTFHKIYPAIIPVGIRTIRTFLNNQVVSIPTTITLNRILITPRINRTTLIIIIIATVQTILLVNYSNSYPFNKTYLNRVNKVNNNNSDPKANYSKVSKYNNSNHKLSISSNFSNPKHKDNFSSPKYKDNSSLFNNQGRISTLSPELRNNGKKTFCLLN